MSPLFLDFIHPDLCQISCDKPSTDGYEVTNLISDKPNLRQKGFLTESFIAPPVAINLKFICPIEISHVVVQTNVGPHKSVWVDLLMGKALFNRDMCKFGQLNRAKASFPDVNLIYFINRSFHGRPDIHQPLNTCTRNIEANKTTVQLLLTVTRTSPGRVPALGRIEVWGRPLSSRHIPPHIYNTIESICQKSMEDSTESSMPTNININNTIVCTKLEGKSFSQELCTRNDDASAVVRNVPEDVPNEFVDSISCDIMTFPVLLPSSHNIDQQTLEKYMEYEASYGRMPNDPFTGLPFNNKRKPVFNVALKARIDAYLLRFPDAANGIARTVGRRQDGPAWSSLLQLPRLGEATFRKQGSQNNDVKLHPAGSDVKDASISNVKIEQSSNMTPQIENFNSAKKTSSTQHSQQAPPSSCLTKPLVPESVKSEFPPPMPDRKRVRVTSSSARTTVTSPSLAATTQLRQIATPRDSDVKKGVDKECAERLATGSARLSPTFPPGDTSSSECDKKISRSTANQRTNFNSHSLSPNVNWPPAPNSSVPNNGMCRLSPDSVRRHNSRQKSNLSPKPQSSLTSIKFEQIPVEKSHQQLRESAKKVASTFVKTESSALVQSDSNVVRSLTPVGSAASPTLGTFWTPSPAKRAKRVSYSGVTDDCSSSLSLPYSTISKSVEKSPSASPRPQVIPPTIKHEVDISDTRLPKAAVFCDGVGSDTCTIVISSDEDDAIVLSSDDDDLPCMLSRRSVSSTQTTSPKSQKNANNSDFQCKSVKRINKEDLHLHPNEIKKKSKIGTKNSVSRSVTHEQRVKTSLDLAVKNILGPLKSYTDFVDNDKKSTFEGCGCSNPSSEIYILPCFHHMCRTCLLRKNSSNNFQVECRHCKCSFNRSQPVKIHV